MTSLPTNGAAIHDEAVAGLQSLTALAAVAGAPLAAVRRWWRRGYLRPAGQADRLPLFDLNETRVARRLARLLDSVGSLARVDALVAELEGQLPEADRPLASPLVDAQGGRLLVRRDHRLTEPCGQVMLDFDAPNVSDAAPTIRLPDRSEDDPEALRDEAWRRAEQGDRRGAIEVCRVVLLSGDARADDHYLLANLLYEEGDQAAARERYYAAVECEPGFVEARINLGCVLAECGEDDAAVAVLRGAVEGAPDRADARLCLARLLDETGAETEAVDEWRVLLDAAPHGPWSDEARRRLERAARPPE